MESTAVPIPIVMRTIMGAIELGMMCRKMMFQSLAPQERAASTNSELARPRTVARTVLA